MVSRAMVFIKEVLHRYIEISMDFRILFAKNAQNALESWNMLGLRWDIKKKMLVFLIDLI